MWVFCTFNLNHFQEIILILIISNLNHFLNNFITTFNYFICYLNALVFTGISCFSYFICLDDRIILICDCMIYSFIRGFAGTHAN